MTEMHDNVLPLKPMGIQIDYNFCYSTLQFHGGLIFKAQETEIVFSVDQANYHSISFLTNSSYFYCIYESNQFSLKARPFQAFVAKTFVFPTRSSIF